MEPLKFDAAAVLADVRKATTEDLLDRVTAYRGGMEPGAVVIIEAELRDRGISAADIRAHEDALGEGYLRTVDGVALSCSFCRRPAVACAWGWHRLWRMVPLFPRRFRYCVDHVSSRSDHPRRSA